MIQSMRCIDRGLADRSGREVQGEKPERRQHHDLDDDDGNVGAGHAASIAATVAGGCGAPAIHAPACGRYLSDALNRLKRRSRNSRRGQSSRSVGSLRLVPSSSLSPASNCPSCSSCNRDDT